MYGLNNILKLNTEAQYKELVAVLDQLIDEVGNDENHQRASLMELIGMLIEQYEDENVTEPGGMLTAECAKLDKTEEQRLADEG